VEVTVTNPIIDPAVLERRLSVERLAPYRAAAGGDLDRAVELYEWNTEASAAFWATLSNVEVLVRNAMHEHLTAWSLATYGESRWYLNTSGVLTPEARRVIQDARRHATRNGRRETPGRVVAELAMGFWRYLLASRYERTLWIPCLRSAFPRIRGRGMRRDVHDALAQLHILRNRIAHHEPIHNRPLEHLHQTALAVAGWVCPNTQRWIEARSPVGLVLMLRPDASGGPDAGRVPVVGERDAWQFSPVPQYARRSTSDYG
jgi:hypothetical protein